MKIEWKDILGNNTQNTNSKLTYDEVVEIKKSLILGHPEFGTRPLAEKYGVDHKVIMDIYHNHKYQEVKIPYTFFVSSDIHSAYTPWIKALKKAGFNENKYTHKLIICGDLFDRKDESIEVLRFVMKMIEKDKIILVKGNHDILLEECCMRGFPYSYDKSNGTAKTIWHLGKLNSFEECCQTTWGKLARYRELLVNYFETQNYIFVHSWIPTHQVGKPHPADKWITLTEDKYMEDWRNAADSEWEEAMWSNPFKKWERGLNQTGKTIVFGHWHCSLGYCLDNMELTEFGEEAIFEPYYGEGIIAIDSCVAYTGKINVIVLEDNFIENRKRKWKIE